MNSRSIYTLLIVLLVFLNSSNPCRAQEGTSETLDHNWIVHHFTNDDGLKQMQVEDIHIAKSGLIWLATRGGVCTFDGSSFDRFNDLDNKPLYAKRIEERSNGDIVIDAGRSLFVFNGDSFKEYPFPKSYNTSTYSSMVVDWKDNIWLQNRNTTEPYVFIDSIFVVSESFDHPFFKHTSFLIPDTINKCYYSIQDEKNIVKYCEGETELVYESSSDIKMWKNFLLSNNPHGFRFRNAEKGYKYFEFSTGKIYSLLPFSHDVFELSRNNINLDIFDGVNLWINDGNQFVQLIDGIQDKYNHFYCYERNGNSHYVGTGKGLVKITKSPFNVYSEKDFHSINFIKEVGDELYFGSYGDGLISLSDQKIQYIPQPIGNSNGRCNNRNYYHPSLIGKDSLMVPTECGLYLLNNNISKYIFPSLNEQSISTIFTYYDDGRELIIVSSCPGVYILNKRFEVVKFLNKELIDHRCMLTTAIDDDGHYWLGGSGGVSKYDIEKDQITNYSYADGSFPIQGATCSLIDDYGNLWFGSRDGLCVFNNKKQEFEKVEQLKNYSISSIIHTDSNTYFLNTIDGLMMADLSEYGLNKDLKYAIYTKSNGFNALEPGQNGLYQDNEGMVWTTSATNVISFDPNDLKYSQHKVIPYIKTINEQRLSNNKVELEHGQNSATVQYGNLSTQSKQQLIYRLNLNNGEWSDWTNKTSKEYQSLASDNYKIQVQAKVINENDANAETTSASFKVALPVNKEPYFVNLMLSLFFVLTALFLWVYQSRRNQRNMNKVLADHNVLLSEKNDGLLTDKEKLTQLNNTLASSLDSLKINQKNGHRKKIKVSSFDKSYSINPDVILYLQSDKKITKISQLEKPAIWSNQSLKLNYKLLKDFDFIQIQRSTVINLSHIDWINTDTLKMVDGTIFKIGRAYKAQLKSYIETMKL